MFRNLNCTIGALISVATINGCSGNQPTGEPTESSALADTGGIQEGTPEALAVLTLVNAASFDELDNAAGLLSNAASNIVSYRAGDDQQSGTVDDEVFDTLAELDAVPFVGPSAFSHLLAYAQSQGMVCTPKSCGADSCGPTDDGCGAVLDCGACAQTAQCNFDRMFEITGKCEGAKSSMVARMNIMAHLVPGATVPMLTIARLESAEEGKRLDWWTMPPAVFDYEKALANAENDTPSGSFPYPGGVSGLVVGQTGALYLIKEQQSGSIYFKTLRIPGSFKVNNKVTLDDKFVCSFASPFDQPCQELTCAAPTNPIECQKSADGHVVLTFHSVQSENGSCVSQDYEETCDRGGVANQFLYCDVTLGVPSCGTVKNCGVSCDMFGNCSAIPAGNCP